MRTYLWQFVEKKPNTFIRQARKKQIKSEGAKFLISKWKYLSSKF